MNQSPKECKNKDVIRELERFFKDNPNALDDISIGFSARLKLIGDGRVPQYKTSGAACADCYARIEPHKDNPEVDYIVIHPHRRALVPLGFAMALPVGYEAVIRPRSGLTKQGIDGQIGTIDSDYRGEVSACLVNNSDAPFKVRNGDRICQMKIQRAERLHFAFVDELDETERGEGGFGSTGIR